MINNITRIKQGIESIHVVIDRDQDSYGENNYDPELFTRSLERLCANIKKILHDEYPGSNIKVAVGNNVKIDVYMYKSKYKLHDIREIKDEEIVRNWVQIEVEEAILDFESWSIV